MVVPNFIIANKPASSKVIRVPKDTTDLQTAFDLAGEGDCIFIASGEYTVHKPLLIHKSVHLLGDEDGSQSGVIITLDRAKICLPRATHMLTVDADSVRIARITFTCVDSSSSSSSSSAHVLTANSQLLDELVFCLFLRRGNIILEHCRLYSSFASCVGVGAQCVPTLLNCLLAAKEYGCFVSKEAVLHCRRTEIKDCTTCIFFDEDSNGVIEDSKISTSAVGIEMVARSHPVIRRNEVFDCRTAGFYGSRGAPNAKNHPIIQLNVIRSNKIGIIIECESNPTIEKNTIIDNLEIGVKSFNSGKGTILMNDISNNRIGIMLATESSTDVTKNSIHHNSEAGVCIFDPATIPVITDNDVEYNGVVGVLITDNASPALLSNRVSHNLGIGMKISSCNVLKADTNAFTSNGSHGVYAEGSSPLFIRNCIEGNSGNGLMLVDNCQGTYTNNVIRSNYFAGAEICRSVGPAFIENKISENKSEGFLCHNESQITSHCDLLSDNLLMDMYATADSVIAVKDGIPPPEPD